MKNIITADQIQFAVFKGACREAVAWLQETPRTWEMLVNYHPDWFLWAAGEGMVPHDSLTPKIIDTCAEKEPGSALAYASQLLTTERIDWCAERASICALCYCPSLLTPQRLDACARREPYTASKHAASLLTPERLDWCKTVCR